MFFLFELFRTHCTYEETPYHVTKLILFYSQGDSLERQLLSIEGIANISIISHDRVWGGAKVWPINHVLGLTT